MSQVCRVLGCKSLPSSSQRNIRLEIRFRGSGFYLSAKLTSRETHILLSIVSQGAASSSTPKNIQPGKERSKIYSETRSLAACDFLQRQERLKALAM